MTRYRFEPPVDHYNENIKEVDEQICSLLKERKELSNNNPGFPSNDFISLWAKKYHFYEDFLNSLFSLLLNEDLHRPMVEPKGFIKNIPILKSFEHDEVFYSVPFIRQYENASVIHLNMDSHVVEDLFDEQPRPKEFHHFELSIDANNGIEYDCRSNGGGGSREHMSYSYIVSPPLQIKSSDTKLTFHEFKSSYKQEPTGMEFSIVIS
ncbi:hypothetical protein [Alkalihalobacillus sp. 1P02AB]|uniref:hypothetical protein n=1 Tax=Alkalihalobacillus sp. 1P02AB TaxID=3132260 RepID=UPI0039A71B17